MTANHPDFRVQQAISTTLVWALLLRGQRAAVNDHRLLSSERIKSTNPTRDWVGTGEPLFMLPSIFNVQVPLPERNEVFLMNTFSDAQLLVTPDVTELLDRIRNGESAFDAD